MPAISGPSTSGPRSSTILPSTPALICLDSRPVKFAAVDRGFHQQCQSNIGRQHIFYISNWAIRGLRRDGCPPCYGGGKLTRGTRNFSGEAKDGYRPN